MRLNSSFVLLVTASVATRIRRSSALINAAGKCLLAEDNKYLLAAMYRLRGVR